MLIVEGERGSMEMIAVSDNASLNEIPVKNHTMVAMKRPTNLCKKKA
jgi:hypothetical protein